MKKKMKKTILLAFALGALMLPSNGCKKESKYCAACVEAHSGYKPADFCGDESEVDTYISELKKQGSAVGQSWSCTKN